MTEKWNLQLRSLHFTSIEMTSLAMVTTLFYFTAIKMTFLTKPTTLFYFTTINMKSLTTLTTLFYFTTIKMTSLTTHESFSPALLHISCVLKISAINSREHGFLSTSLLHTSWTTRLTTGVYFSVYNKICLITLLNELIILIPLPSDEVQILWT